MRATITSLSSAPVNRALPLMVAVMGQVTGVEAVWPPAFLVGWRRQPAESGVIAQRSAQPEGTVPRLPSGNTTEQLMVFGVRVYFGWYSWRFWWRYLSGPTALLVLVVCATQLGPAWSAHLGSGHTGTWTVTSLACVKDKRCDDVGRFVSSDGSDVRAGIHMSGNPSLGVGGSLPAVDTGGGEVYPLGGGHAWWAFALATVLSAAFSAFWTWIFPVRAIRRRRAMRQPPLLSGD